MRLQTFILDTFTSSPFSGNPTGVCCPILKIDASLMLSIAQELNFPVTAFIRERNDSSVNEFDIRYFTPTTEIPACGHATLASAKVVSIILSYKKAKFHTRSGITIKTSQEGNLTTMQYPLYDLEKISPPEKILHGLGISSCKTAGYSTPLETLFIEVQSPDLLRSIKPNFAKLLAARNTIKEVVITSVSDNPQYDYLLRSFCPWIGIDEDPVTGSVHSVLAGFWASRLNKTVMNVYQASLRGGELSVKLLHDHVEIGGKTVTILEGSVLIHSERETKRELMNIRS